MSTYQPDPACARQDLCRFLSACYYEPCTEFTEEKLFDSMGMAAEQIDPALAKLARQLGAAFAAQDQQTLLVDYTRLFLGPVQPLASPYGSFWLPPADPMQENPGQGLLELYREGGFEIDQEFNDLPDHVAVQLEFLYLLTFNANQALVAGRPDDAAAVERLRRRLLDEHLGAWIGRFTAAVKAGAETAFYRTLAELTACFVQGQAGAPLPPGARAQPLNPV